MKNVFCLFLILVLSLGLCSCFSGGVQETDTSSGNYKFISKAGEGSNLALSVWSGLDPPHENGQQLVVSSYANDNDYTDEWGFNTKYFTLVNYYDSTYVGNDFLIQTIQEANIFARDMMAKYFGVPFLIETATFYEGALQDECDSENCANCGDDCSADHHKNIDRIADQLLENKEERHVYAMWSTRRSDQFCQELTSGHSVFDTKYTGMVTITSFGPIPVIHLFGINYSYVSETVAEENVKRTNYISMVKHNFLHELSHTFGMEDVNDDKNYSVLQCVMQGCRNGDDLTESSFIDAVEEQIVSPYCSSCMIQMKGHVSAHCGEGF